MKILKLWDLSPKTQAMIQAVQEWASEHYNNTGEPPESINISTESGVACIYFSGGSGSGNYVR